VQNEYRLSENLQLQMRQMGLSHFADISKPLWATWNVGWMTERELGMMGQEAEEWRAYIQSFASKAIKLKKIVIPSFGPTILAGVTLLYWAILL
jgi:hypothetical protein